MTLIDVADRNGLYSETVTGIPGASMRIAYVQGADFKIELIEYLSPKGEKLDTRTCNVGSAHICFTVDELQDMYVEMQRIVRDEGGALIFAFGNNVEAGTRKLKNDGNIAGNWLLDGYRLTERWWFEG